MSGTVNFNRTFSQSVALSDLTISDADTNLIVKNTAYKVAVREEAIFTQKDFVDEIFKEKDANFDGEKSMGFLA